MIVAQNAPASTLADLIAQVRDALAAIGNATPVQVGAHYLEHFGVGSAPSILFVPDAKGGKIGPPLSMGNPASVTHACGVAVAAAEGPSVARSSADVDIDRFRAAYALADLVVDLIATAAPGRIEWGAWEDDSATSSDAFGAAFKFSFTYRRDVVHTPRRWALPAAVADTSTRPSSLPDNRGGVGVPGLLGDVEGSVTTVITTTTPTT